MILNGKRLVVVRGCRTGTLDDRRRRKAASNVGIGPIGERVVLVDHPHHVPAGTPEYPRRLIREQPVTFAAEPPCRIDNQACRSAFARILVHRH
jgi:hypothetical protein